MEENSPTNDLYFTATCTIPGSVMECRTLSDKAKLLFIPIYTLAQSQGFCWATTEQLGKMFGLQKRCIYKFLDELEKEGFIKREREMIVKTDPETHQKSFRTLRKIYLNYERLYPQKSNNVCGSAQTNTSLGDAQSCTSLGDAQSCTPIRENINIRNIKKTNTVDTCEKSQCQHDKAISFSSDQQEFIGVTDKDLQDWSLTYVNINIHDELRKATEWLKANPTKAKQKKLWRKFLYNWFNNANERAMNREVRKAIYQNDSPRNAANRKSFGLTLDASGKPIEVEELF